MSSHFTYEIDERKLRVKLNDIETVPDEEAWQKFEAFANSQNTHHSSNPLKDVKLPLNRNVIIPVVFGALIIVFSVLLFNFINIKKPVAKAPESEIQATPDSSVPQQNQTTIQQNNTEGTSPVVNTTTHTLAKTVNTATNTNQTVVTKTVSTLVPPPGVVVNKTIPAPTVQAVNKAAVVAQTSPTQAAVTQPTVQAVVQNSLSADNQAGAKKKSKRRNVEELQSDSSNENRQAPGGEDRDTDIRPN